MAARRLRWLLVSSAASIAGLVLPASSESQNSIPDAQTDAPSAVSVTLYRDPYRASGSITLDRLNGFALITETRAVHLQVGDQRLRFEGVADGIEPESAILTGLEDGSLEKNRDAAVLSPSALVAAAVGKPLVLTRTNPRTGRVERVSGTVESDAQGGVIFKSEQGIEALRCSGLPETLSFEGTGGLRSHPTPVGQGSIAPRAERHGDLVVSGARLRWAADYTATLAADGRTMDLGAWITLANGNGTGFPGSAHTGGGRPGEPRERRGRTYRRRRSHRRDVLAAGLDQRHPDAAAIRPGGGGRTQEGGRDELFGGGADGGCSARRSALRERSKSSSGI